MLPQAIMLGAAAGLASAAHCAVMCGPLAAAGCGREAPARSLAAYQLGRFASYGMAGAIAGGAGEALAWTASPPWLGFALPWLTALSLGVLAYRLLRPRPALIKLRVRGDRPLFSRLAELAPTHPIALGALSVFLPCAALAAALLLAAATLSRAQGAAVMLTFCAVSALGVIGGGLALRSVTRLSKRIAPRALAIGLATAALYIGLSPLFARTAESPGNSVPSCHQLP